MHFMIIGGGWISINVAKMLSTAVDRLTIIEKDPQVCEKVSNILAAYVFNADGTDVNTLRAADIDKTDGLLVLTRDDVTNLEICKVAKTTFSVPYILTLVNHIENSEQFRQLGVDVVEISPIILSSIQDRLKLLTKQLVFLDEQRNIAILELRVAEDSPLIGKGTDFFKKIGVIPLMLYRDGMRSSLSDNIVLQANDIVFVGGDKKKMDNFLYVY